MWRNQDSRVRFTYPNIWEQSTPIEEQTLVAINWLSKKSGGLIATCYLQEHSSTVGNLTQESVHANKEAIAQSVLSNTKKRDPKAVLIKASSIYQDNYPAIYIERTMVSANVESVSKLRIYSIITSWNDKEVLFECASSVPDRFPETKEHVEGNIFRVLRSLQFVRS